MGDLLLVSDYSDVFYFGAPLKSVQGGLHPQDSAATLVYFSRVFRRGPPTRCV